MIIYWNINWCFVFTDEKDLGRMWPVLILTLWYFSLPYFKSVARPLCSCALRNFKVRSRDCFKHNFVKALTTWANYCRCSWRRGERSPLQGGESRSPVNKENPKRRSGRRFVGPGRVTLRVPSIIAPRGKDRNSELSGCMRLTEPQSSQVLANILVSKYSLAATKFYEATKCSLIRTFDKNMAWSNQE